MSTEKPGRGELSELVPDHVLANEYWHMATAVVYGDRMANHVREDGAGTRPRTQYALLACAVHPLYALEQPLLHEGSLLSASRHSLLSSYLLRRRTMYLSLGFFLRVR